jgi:hypothetical protein
VTDPYELLAAFARWQQELVEEERFEELAELGERWDALVRSFPPGPPPGEARPQLEDAERSLASNIASVETALDAVRAELARLGANRRVAASYGGAQGLERVSTLDAQG